MGRRNAGLASREYQRLAGVELVQNRIKMTARLDGDVIILHIPAAEPPGSGAAHLLQIRKSLDRLEPFARRHNVRIALENMPGMTTWF